MPTTLPRATAITRPIYDDMTRLQIMGEVAINTNGALDLTLRGDYHLWRHRPASTWTSPLRHPADQLQHRRQADCHRRSVHQQAQGQVLAEVPDARLENDGTYTVDLKGYADVNLNVEYRYTKRVSAFVRLNNMVGGRYQQRVNYRVQTFNAMMGATYSF